jgi:GntR family transcriptional regulator
MHTGVQWRLDTLRLQSGGVPIYVQLRDQLLGAIGAGRLSPGERMPTMRQVAVALKIDLNTVKHAYDELERAGAIVLVRGSGSFVAEIPPQIDRTANEERVAALAHRTIAAATAEGIDPAAVAHAMIALADGQRPVTQQAARRQAAGRQGDGNQSTGKDDRS